MTFETCVKFHCTCSCCRTWRQRGALEKFVQMCPMYVCTYACERLCVCLCVASGISSCLATIWASFAGTVRAAEATHETCLLINTAMNHCTFPARGVSWQNAFVSLHLHTCVYVYMYLCGYMYCTHAYVVHYSVLCSLLLLLFFGFLLRFLWFVCDFHASFRLVCVRSLLGYASNMHTDTHTHTRMQSYVLISCPFTSLSLSLSLSVFRTICVMRALASLWDLPQPTRTFVLLVVAICVAVLLATAPNMDGGREERHPAACFTDKHA